MIDKKYLEPFINDEFPDLKNTRFRLNGKALSRFTENTLLPFLIYQNTTDSKNRLIQLYLQENSASIHFLPFYIALGFYRKAIDSAFRSQDFKSSKYQIGKKQVTLNGSICSITNINFINKSVTLHHGTGFVTEIPMSEDFKLSWQYPDAYDLREKLSKFDRLLRLSDQNLFSLPIPKDDVNHEGIIVFTHISKFEALLRNLKVSESSLSDYLGVHRTIFNNHTQSISFKQISGIKTKGRQPTVLASRLSDMFAYNQILSAGGGQYNHLKTVIIEDFDLELRSWERNGTLEENLEAMNEIYFSKLGNGIKDIYLVCRNRNFDIHSLLKKNGIRPMRWLLTPVEASVMDESGGLEDVLVKEFSEPPISDLIVNIEQQLLLWKSLSEQYFCLGQTLEIVTRLYGIRDKLNSFYSPHTFAQIITSLKESINQLKSRWFTSGQDYGVIDQTICILDRLLSIEVNPTIRLSLEIISSINDTHKLITIVTNNRDKDDHNYLKSIIASKGTPLRFFTSKEFLGAKVDHPNLKEKLIYLVWNREVVNNLLTNFSLPEQLFLVSMKGYEFVRTYSMSAWKSISSISSTNEKYDLLNIDNIDGADDRIPFPENIIFFEKIAIELDNEITPLPEVEETIMHIVSKSGKRRSLQSHNEASVNVFFEDGSHLSFAENRSVFYYDEEAGETTADLQKDAKDLEENDLIIVPKNKVEIKKLLNETLSENDDFAGYVSGDLEWRYKLGDSIHKSNGDLTMFREKLRNNGISIEADITIRNWIEGETLEPRNFNNLLLILAKIDILDIEKIPMYLAGAKILKRLKSRFVRTAMQKLIYNLKGIDFSANEDLFDVELLNGFLDHVEMKKVLIVVGGNHAH